MEYLSSYRVGMELHEDGNHCTLDEISQHSTACNSFVVVLGIQ